MNAKLKGIVLVLTMTLTIIQYVPNVEASEDILLEINNDDRGKICATKDYHIVQEFKTKSDEIWNFVGFSLYGYMNDLDIEYGLKESKTSPNWICKFTDDKVYNSGGWYNFYGFFNEKLVPEKTYFAVVKIKSGNAEFKFSYNEYTDGKMYISNDNGYSFDTWENNDLFFRVRGSKIERQKNHYAVFISAGEQWGEASTRQLKYTIDRGYWTKIKTYIDDVSKSDIQSAIDWLYSKSQSGDCTLLFYYVGHSSHNAITDSSANKINDITLELLFSKFQISDKLILIFETCYSGRLDKEKSMENNILQRFSFLNNCFKTIKEKIPLISKFIENNIFKNKKVYTSETEDDTNTSYDGIFINLVKPGRTVLAASRARQPAYKHKTSYSAAFTYYLIKAIEHNSYIEPAFKEAKTATKNHVLTNYADFQTPQMGDRTLDDIRIK